MKRGTTYHERALLFAGEKMASALSAGGPAHYLRLVAQWREVAERLLADAAGETKKEEP